MVWKRFSHEIGFGTGARLERVCIRKNIPDGLNPNKPRWYIEGFSKKGAVALQEKCKSTAPAVARGVMGLGKCVGFSTATQENSGRISGGAEHASRSD